MHAEAVTVHRLTLRAPAALQARLRRELSEANWPTDEAWVFIRRLQVRAPSQAIARALITEAQQHLHGHGDNVVRFDSLAQLLAALLTDRLRGHAGLHWYWRRWAHLFAQPLPRAIVRLLSEHSETLPSVCAHLGHMNQLLPVWQALDSDAASELAHGLARRSGLTLPTAQQRQHALYALTRPRAFVPLTLPRTLIRRWSPLVRSTAPDDARQQLALLVVAQEFAPLRLRQEPAVLLAQIQWRFQTELAQGEDSPARLNGVTAEAPYPARNTPAPVSLTSAPALSAPPTAAAPKASLMPAEPKPEGDTTAPTDKTLTHVLNRARRAADAPMPRVLYNDNEPVPPPGTPGRVPSADGARPECKLKSDSTNTTRSPPSTRLDRCAPALPAFERLATAQGGLLYLLNTLNRPEAQSLMGDYWQALPNGWAWLYRLGQRLELDQNDGLCARLAGELGLDDTAELEALPPLPEPGRWDALLERWYGASGVWTPALLHLNAELAFSPSHIDLYAPMSAVRLPVRLAGLDINPGWLPWLGRTVRFHYGATR